MTDSSHVRSTRLSEVNGHAAAAVLPKLKAPRRKPAFREAEPRSDIVALSAGVHEWECREGGAEPMRIVVADSWFNARHEAARVFGVEPGKLEVKRK